jgi:hypothetical protein
VLSFKSVSLSVFSLEQFRHTIYGLVFGFAGKVIAEPKELVNEGVNSG